MTAAAMIRFREERPPVSAEALAAAEQRLAEFGFRMPPSYREFLQQRDWGRPVESVFAFRRSGRPAKGDVRYFLGVAPVPSPGMNLVDVAATFEPAGVLPIADDAGGNHICLDGREGRDGPVLFWDHEEGTGEPGDESNLYFVAPDLQSFLDSLTEPEPIPEARRAGDAAQEDAETAGVAMQGALIGAHGALVAPGAPAYGQIAGAAGIPRPQPPQTKPIGEREPPEDWPGWRKAWFKLGRGEATALQGMYRLGRGAVEHPDKVPGALYGFGKGAVDDPVGTGKQLIGYDELARGRYEDWLGQLGIGVLTGGAAARATRLRRVAGSPKPYKLGTRQPRGGAGRLAGTGSTSQSPTSAPARGPARRSRRTWSNSPAITRAGCASLAPDTPSSPRTRSSASPSTA